MVDIAYHRERFVGWYERNVAANTSWPRAYICYMAHPSGMAVPHQHRLDSEVGAERWKREMLDEIGSQQDG